VVDSKFSHQHAVAVTLIDGPPVLSSFDPECYGRADLAAFRERISVEIGEEYDRVYPHHYGAELVATLKSGEEKRASVSDALGDPANPVTNERIIEKARELMLAADWTPERGNGIIDNCARLASGGTIDEMTKYLN
jgi:2-methylcitrate dehydratase PrpD